MTQTYHLITPKLPPYFISSSLQILIKDLQLGMRGQDEDLGVSGFFGRVCGGAGLSAGGLILVLVGEVED